MGKLTFMEAAIMYFVEQGNGLIDEDKANVLANETWDAACKGDNKARAKIGEIMRLYKG